MEFNHNEKELHKSLGFETIEEISKLASSYATKLIVSKDPKLDDKTKLAVLAILSDNTQILGTILNDLLGKEDELNCSSKVIEYLFNAITNDSTYSKLAILTIKDSGLLKLLELLRD